KAKSRRMLWSADSYSQSCAGEIRTPLENIPNCTGRVAQTCHRTRKEPPRQSGTDLTRKAAGLHSSAVLAEPSTRSHLSELITFISLPAEILSRLEHSEKHLNPFYEDLENRFTATQSSSTTTRWPTEP